MSALGADRIGSAAHLLCDSGQVISLSGPRGAMSEEALPSRVYGVQVVLVLMNSVKCVQGATSQVPWQTSRGLLLFSTPSYFGCFMAPEGWVMGGSEHVE